MWRGQLNLSRLDRIIRANVVLFTSVSDNRPLFEQIPML
jgi:hypothetical protein